MGAISAVLTLLFVEPKLTGIKAMAGAGFIVALVGSICAVICSRIDARFDYFGGPENGTLFIWSGIIPTILGGILFGWWLYRNKQYSFANERHDI